MQQQHQLLLALRERPSMLLVWHAKLTSASFTLAALNERSSTSCTVGIRHGGGCPTPTPSPSPVITCYAQARCQRRRHQAALVWEMISKIEKCLRENLVW
jgi:hypothetical protein